MVNTNLFFSQIKFTVKNLPRPFAVNVCDEFYLFILSFLSLSHAKITAFLRNRMVSFCWVLITIGLIIFFLLHNHIFSAYVLCLCVCVFFFYRK